MDKGNDALGTHHWFRSKKQQEEDKGAGRAEGAADKRALDSSSDEEERQQQQQREKERQQAQQQQQREKEGEEEDQQQPPPLAADPSEELPPAEDRPRVLAYSDSDSDVETHIKRVSRVKKALLPPPSDDERGADEQGPSSGEAAASATAAAAAQAAADAQRQQQEAAAVPGRLQRNVGAAFASVAHHVAPHLTAGFAARLCTLLLLRRLNPSVEDAVELLTVAIPMAGAAASKLGIRTGGLPEPVRMAGHQVSQLGKAAAVLSLARLLGRGLQHQRQGRGAGRQRMRRMKSVVNVASLQTAESLRREPDKPPETAAEFAGVFAVEMAEMRRMLAENGVELPERFDDAELLRYANACGLLAAKTVEERAAAVEGGVRRIVNSIEWLSSQRFLSDAKLRRWDRLVLWKSHDAQGHPILLVRMGRALQLVKPERMQEFMDAVLSQVNRGMQEELSNEKGQERTVVVIDARGASSLALTRHMSLLKHVAVTLNQHYPDRLHKLYLLELPLLLRWAVQVVLPLLHPVTRTKVVLSSMEDPDLPVTVALLAKRRSVGFPLQRTASELTLPGSGGSTPGELLSPCTSLAEAPFPTSGPSSPRAPEGAAGLATRGAAPSGSRPPSLGARPVAGSSNSLGEPDAWDAWQAAQVSSPGLKPATLEAAWGAVVSSNARKSFEFRGVGPVPASVLSPSSAAATAAGSSRGEEEGSPSPPTSTTGALQRASHELSRAAPPGGLGDALLFQKSISVPSLTHAGSSSFDLGRASPRHLPHTTLPAQPHAAGAAREAGGSPSPDSTSVPTGPLGPGNDGGISSFEVPLSPALTLSREVSDATSSAAVEERGGAGGSAGTTPAEAAGTLAPAPCSSESGEEGEQGGGGKWAAVMGWLGRGPQPAEASSSSPAESAGGAQDAEQEQQQAGGGSAVIEEGSGGNAAAPTDAAAARQGPLRMGSFASSRGSSANSSPRTPRGGLKELPERRRRRGPGSGLTPRKPSLRREPSLERSHPSGSGGQLGSHPLRHQSSVSWADELEVVQEIAEFPEVVADGSPQQEMATHLRRLGGGSSNRSSSSSSLQRPLGGNLSFSPYQLGSRRQRLAATAAAIALMPAMLLALLVAVLMQQSALLGVPGLPGPA